MARRLIVHKPLTNHRTWEDRQSMADDRMKNDDAQRNMGGAKDQEHGQQAPGRGQQGGQQAGGSGSGQQKSNYGGQNERDMEDDDVGAGNAQTGGQGRGGQNR